ncbi:MAG TPA: hypothetical protein VK306_07635 [Acidimicrobiales bacterium]|nr:hypothetical protein [Acidimicrobiales bacterium]
MDLSKLTPADAAVALRGLERRYRALFAGLGEDESPDDLAHRRVEGWSAIDHIVAAARAIGGYERAMHAVLTRDTPELSPADLDDDPHPPLAPTGTVHERISELGMETVSMAERIEGVPASDWTREGVVGDGPDRRVTSMDLVRGAVDAGVSHLDAARNVLSAAVGKPGPQR